MHAEPTPEHVAPEIPPSVPEPPTAGEWAIGSTFVLASLLLVAWIAWSIAAL